MFDGYWSRHSLALLVSGLILVQGCGVLDLSERQLPDRQMDQHMNEKGSGHGGRKTMSRSKVTSLHMPGRLKVHPTNPAYFQDTSTGNAVFLHGVDHFRSRQEFDNNGIEPLDFDAFLAQRKQFNHNFLRLWVWDHFWRKVEHPNGDSIGEESIVLTPHVYQRTGPGTAIDGRPTFDLQRFDQAYFDRLRQRVITAGESGMWVSVMLFQGWSIQGSGEFANSQWEGHPFNRQNNMNGVDGDYDQDGRGLEVHTRINTTVNALHDAYVKKVIDTVGDLDNVLFEISNETIATATTEALHHVTRVRDWAYHLINLIHEYERQQEYGPHPVGMSSLRPLSDDPMSDDWNQYVFESPAEYVSPNGTKWTGDEHWKNDPPAATGKKVVIADTDHIHPSMHGGPGMRSWQWRTFTRGHSVNAVAGDPEKGHDWVNADDSATMYVMSRYVVRVNLARMKPYDILSSTRYCLADPGDAYIVYQPTPGLEGSSLGFPFELELQAGAYDYEWFNPETNQIVETGEMQWVEGISTFTPPFNAHAVLFLNRRLSE